MNNTVVRTLSGLVYGALIFLCLLVNGYLFAALIIFMMCVMMAEFYRMTMGDSYKFSRGLAIGAGVILFLLLYFCRAFQMPGKFVALASGFDGDDDALPIRAEARVLGATLKAGETTVYDLGAARHAYLVAAAGRIEVNGVELDARDGAAITGEERLVVKSLQDAEVVLVDAA